MILGTTRERKDGMVDKEAVAVLLLCGKETVTGWVEGLCSGAKDSQQPQASLHITHPLLWGGGICTDLGLVISGQFYFFTFSGLVPSAPTPQERTGDPVSGSPAAFVGVGLLLL